jgi:3-methyladenine DNA glycosylase/8-oxoguanine DNA glycosylase
MQLKSTRSLFGALAEAIVYQQLSNKAAATIYGRLEALYPRARPAFAPRHVLRTADERLRGVGLSRAKVLALQDLARRVHEGELPTLEQASDIDDDVLIERLVTVRGIGVWSAQMFLMFRLGRPDVLPLDDYSLRKAYAKAFNKRKLPSREVLDAAGEKWRPFRTVACWYLWQTLNGPSPAPLE